MGRVPKCLSFFLRGIFFGDDRPKAFWEGSRKCGKSNFVANNSENKFGSIYSVEKGPSQPNGTTLRLGYGHPPALGGLHGPPFTNHPMQCMTRPYMYLRSRSRARFIIHPISSHLPMLMVVFEGWGFNLLLTVLKLLVFYAAILTLLLFVTFLQTLLILHFITTLTITSLRIVLLWVGDGRLIDLRQNGMVHEWSLFIWLAEIAGIFFIFFRFWKFGILRAHPPLNPSFATGEMVITGSVFQQFGPPSMGKGKGGGKGRGKGRANPPYSHMDWQTLAYCGFGGENSEFRQYKEDPEEFCTWSSFKELSVRISHFFFHSWFVVPG